MSGCDVLLIYPPLPRSIKTLLLPQALRAFLPVGLAYLAAVLDENDVDVHIVDMAASGLRGRDIEAIVAEKKPRIVGISSMVGNHNNGLRVADIVRRTCDASIIMGGPHVSALAEETLATGLIDVVCHGEAELTIVDLVKTILGNGPLADVFGISFISDGEVITTEPRELIADLDSLPFPARDKFPVHQYDNTIGAAYIISSRGCPYGCIFCAAGRLYGNKYRSRSAANVAAEIELLCRDLGMSQFVFGDDTFTVDRKRTEAIIGKINDLNLDDVWWACEARVDTVDRQLLDMMKDSGCRKIQFGVESGSDQVLDRVNKGIETDKVTRSVRDAIAVGIDVECSFIIGHPDDTDDTIRATLDYARDLIDMKTDDNRVTVKISVFTPLPGTSVYERREQYGIEILTRNWDRYDFATVVMETEHLNCEQLKKWHTQACKLQRTAEMNTEKHWQLQPYASDAGVVS